MEVDELSVRKRRQYWFRRLDWAFWVIWAIFPVTAWLAYRAHTTVSAVFAESLSPEQERCANLFANPTGMSPMGQVLFWSLFALQLSFFAVLIGIFHRMVHRFARGRVFVSETLEGVRLMAIILIVWPFLDTITTDVVAYALHALGDLKFFMPSYTIDVGTIAGGVFLIALKSVIEQAILLQSDHDLTI